MSEPKENFFKRIFVNKNIFYLWTGQIISQSGDSIYEIALLWLVLDLTGSNSLTGLVAMSAYLPILIFGLFFGALVDRYNKKRIMLLADIARALLVLLIPLLYYVDAINALLLGVLTFFIASFNALFNPARDALVGKLVGPKDRLMANTMIYTSWQYAMFIGPAVAGILLAVLGEVHLFTANAATFLLSFFFIYQIAFKRPVVLEKQTDSFKLSGVFDEIKEGFQYMASKRILWVLLLITFIDNLFLMGPAMIGAPIFIKEILGEGIESFAYIQVAYGIGMILGTILLNKFGKKYSNRSIILWGIVLDGLTFFPLLWIDTFAGMFATIVIHAMAIPMIIIIRPSIIQKEVPEEIQGRIFSMINIAVWGCTALSVGLTGIVADFVPINIIYAVIAILAASTGLMGWLLLINEKDTLIEDKERV